MLWVIRQNRGDLKTWEFVCVEPYGYVSDTEERFFMGERGIRDEYYTGIPKYEHGVLGVDYLVFSCRLGSPCQ